MSSRFPVPPGVVAKVVRAAADPDTKIGDLADLLNKDAVLSAQILRTVNSASFGLRHKVGSVDRAIALMGIRPLRNLVLSLGVRDLVPTRSVGDFPLDLFWEGSLRRAAAAQCLAEHLRLSHVEECFTMGLCQDIGLLVRLRDDAGLATRLGRALSEPAERRLALEQEDGAGHDEAGYAMFAEWSFPEELAVPIRFHHRPDQAPEAYRVRARAAHTAEALADLPLVADKQPALEATADRLGALGLDPTLVGPMLHRINGLVVEFAELLGLRVEEQPSYDQIIAMASEGLVKLSLSYEEVTQRLERALGDQRQMAAQLERLNRKLEEQARTDPLTGLANRRSLEESLAREMAVAQRQRTPLTVLMLDLDHFKRINDTCGHQAGDRVLERVGLVLAKLVRSSDTAARYGGEEFAVVLPFTDEAGGRIVAERIRESVQGAPCEWEGRSLEVTASVGGVTARVDKPEQIGSGPELLRRADEALYRAKQQGRNRVCWG